MPQSTSNPPTHRVLVVGVGSIGERHLRCFKTTGRTEVGFVELNPDLRATIAKRYDLPESNFASLDDALAKGFTVGVVCTPANSHIAITTRLVEAGLHVLIEKPLSTSFDGIDKLRTLALAKQRTVGMAYVYRSMPLIIKIREAIQSGKFGKVVQATIVCGQDFRFYRPAYRNIYYNSHATGGGAIQDALTHLVNATEWIVGPITRLTCDAEHKVLEDVNVEDTVHMIARHGEVMASYSLNQHQAANEISLNFACEKGVLRADVHESRWRWTTKPDEPWHDEPITRQERDFIFIQQAQHFLDAVEGKAAVLCTLDQGEQTLRVNLACLESARTQQWVTIRK